MVVLENKILEKPQCMDAMNSHCCCCCCCCCLNSIAMSAKEHAFEMLSSLSGKSNQVYTGVCLISISSSLANMFTGQPSSTSSPSSAESQTTTTHANNQTNSNTRKLQTESSSMEIKTVEIQDQELKNAGAEAVKFFEKSDVTFAPLTAEVIQEYVNTNEPM